MVASVQPLNFDLKDWPGGDDIALLNTILSKISNIPTRSLDAKLPKIKGLVSGGSPLRQLKRVWGALEAIGAIDVKRGRNGTRITGPGLILSGLPVEETLRDQYLQLAQRNAKTIPARQFWQQYAEATLSLDELVLQLAQSVLSPETSSLMPAEWFRSVIAKPDPAFDSRAPAPVTDSQIETISALRLLGFIDNIRNSTQLLESLRLLASGMPLNNTARAEFAAAARNLTAASANGERRLGQQDLIKMISAQFAALTKGTPETRKETADNLVATINSSLEDPAVVLNLDGWAGKNPRDRRTLMAHFLSRIPAEGLYPGAKLTPIRDLAAGDDTPGLNMTSEVYEALGATGMLDVVRRRPTRTTGATLVLAGVPMEESLRQQYLAAAQERTTHPEVATLWGRLANGELEVAGFIKQAASITLPIKTMGRTPKAKPDHQTLADNEQQTVSDAIGKEAALIQSLLGSVETECNSASAIEPTSELFKNVAALSDLTLNADHHERLRDAASAIEIDIRASDDIRSAFTNWVVAVMKAKTPAELPQGMVEVPAGRSRPPQRRSSIAEPVKSDRRSGPPTTLRRRGLPMPNQPTQRFGV